MIGGHTREKRKLKRRETAKKKNSQLHYLKCISSNLLRIIHARGAIPKEEEEEEEFITSGNWRGKHNSLSRGAGADQP